ncbi:MAG TPA: PEP-CTERM sorting domain-containing protein [Humisphaera sp.]|jgi:hypothetical protein|nr:PEP-CTERM sorting domain-containing protein [Humisphaera sp.]
MKRKLLSLSALTGALICSSTKAGVTADSVTTYIPGIIRSDYRTSSAALGGLSSDAGFGSIVTPFNPAFSTTDIVGLQGDGGLLTLHLSAPITIAPGAALGVHAGTGLAGDFNGPIVQNQNPAADFNSRISTLKVSFDGTTFVTVAADHTFTNPSNFYDQGITDPGFPTSPGTHAADQFKPFFNVDDAHPLARFDGKDWTGTLAALNGSAGGDWFDLSGVNLPAINFVQFDTAGTQTMYVDAVVGVPEPGSLSLLGLSLLLLRRRR